MVDKDGCILVSLSPPTVFVPRPTDRNGAPGWIAHVDKFFPDIEHHLTRAALLEVIRESFKTRAHIEVVRSKSPDKFQVTMYSSEYWWPGMTVIGRGETESLSILDAMSAMGKFKLEKGSKEE